MDNPNINHYLFRNLSLLHRKGVVDDIDENSGYSLVIVTYPIGSPPVFFSDIGDKDSVIKYLRDIKNKNKVVKIETTPDINKAFIVKNRNDLIIIDFAISELRKTNTVASLSLIKIPVDGIIYY